VGWNGVKRGVGVATVKRIFTAEARRHGEDKRIGFENGGSMDETTAGNGNPIEEKEIQPRHHMDPRANVNIMGFWYANEEVEQVKRQNERKQAAYAKKRRETWLETEQGKLCMAFYQAFQEYRKYLEEHLHGPGGAHGSPLEIEEHKLFEEGLRMIRDHQEERVERDRKNLERAQKAARCEHDFVDGERCRAPRMKGKKLCRMHERMEEAKALRLDLGSMEDPDSIQIAIKKLQAAVIDGVLDHKQVAALSYLIQLAAWNVTRTSMVARERSGDREIGSSGNRKTKRLTTG